MVYLYYIIGALLESIKSPCVSRTFSLKDLLPTGFRGVFRRLLGSYTGIAAGSWGAAEIRDNGSVTCYRWENDRMVPEDACTGLSKKMADAARAQRALADYKVRKGLLNEK